MSTREASTQPQVRWDDSAVHEVRDLNFCNVASSNDEVTLLFGSSEPYIGQPEVTVHLRNRVRLRPVAAKLLRDLLGRTLSQYEARHGEITDGYQPLPGSEPLAGSRPRVPLLPVDLAERGALLLELVRAFNVPCETERSCKLMPGTMLSKRFLLGLRKASLGAAATIRLPVVFKRLGMPEAFATEARQGLADADFVHFGFEETEGGCVLKFYLEQTGALASALASQAPAEPIQLYLGYKWDPAEPERCAVTRYIAHPGLTPEAIHEKMAGVLQDTDAVALGFCREILDLAADRTGSKKLLYVEVTEEGNPRISFDLNLYSAQLQLSEVYPILAAACRHYAIPQEQFRAFYEGAKDYTLGHVSAGIDREGRSFFTVYFGGQSPHA